MQNQWYLAGAIIAAPFALFLAVELFGLHRRRRRKAIAQRSKQPVPKSRGNARRPA